VRLCGTEETNKYEGFHLEHQEISSDASIRATYLERENARLRRLVAELLVKNEELRQLCLAFSRADGM
jgi:hypothetical protein